MSRRAAILWIVAVLAVWNFVFDYYVARGVTTYLEISTTDPSARLKLDPIMRAARQRAAVRASAAALLVVAVPAVMRFRRRRASAGASPPS